jgi:hypothetical protein
VLCVADHLTYGSVRYVKDENSIFKYKQDGSGAGEMSCLSKHLSCVKWSYILASSAKLRFYRLSPLYKIMVIDKVQSYIFQNVNILRLSYVRLRHVAQ